MSHAMGQIKFKDGTIRYYEYNGTFDVPISHHYATTDEVSKNWREHEWLDCTCGKEEDVSIYTCYGGGFYLKGKACKKCNSVRQEYSEDGEITIIDRKNTDDWANRL